MQASLKKRVFWMTTLPALTGLLLLASYMLASRIYDIEHYNQQSQRLLMDSYVPRIQAIAARDLTREQELDQLVRAMLEEEGVRAATIRSPGGGVQAHAGPRMRPLQAKTPADYSLGQPTVDDGRRWTRDLTGSGIQFEMEFSGDQQRIEILETVLILLLGVVVISMLVYYLGQRLATTITNPMESLVKGIQRIREGRLDTRINAEVGGELTMLRDAINDMARALSEAQSELQQNVDQATEDLRETLETIEIQNIELDMARKEAIKASHMKSEFLANMSHEIRTPLNGIIGFTRLLLRSDLSLRQKDYMSTIQKSSESLLAIINDILDFSKIEAGKLSLEQIPLSLHDVIQEVQNMLAPLAQEKKLEQAAIIYTDVPPTILGDPLRISQILTNLVNNAIKFTEKGSVVVRAMLEEERDNSAIIKITVTDTGTGLTEDMQKGLFTAFGQADQSVTRRVGGTGLGLVISKRLAEEMGGEIGVESSWGKGSTFWFTLKVETDEHDAGSETNFQAFRDTEILLAETNEFARLGLYHMLRGWHALPKEVQSLDQAEDMLVNQGYQGDCIIGLPADGSADERIIQLLRKLPGNRGLRVVLLTNTPDRMAPLLGGLAFPCRVMSKPPTRLRLYDALLEVNGEESRAHLLPSRSPCAGKRVMVVDDHEGNLRLAQVLLSEMGADVVTCNSGSEAIKAFSVQTFDAVFMDIQMPGMDGLQCTLALREREQHSGRHTPIIALTAHALANERQHLLKSGMDDYLTKPVSEQQLAHMLQKWSAEKGAETTPASVPVSPAEPEAPAPSHTRVFDEALALKRCAGKQDLVVEMHRMLIKQIDTDQAILREHTNACERESLLEQVHRLHGATRYCGTPRLENAVRELEVALKQKARDDIIAQGLERLLQEIDRLRQDQALSSITNATT